MSPGLFFLPSLIICKTVIHGHVIVPSVEVAGSRTNINTGRGSRGYLASLVLPENIYYFYSLSPEIDHGWEYIKKELEEEIEEQESL